MKNVQYIIKIFLFLLFQCIASADENKTTFEGYDMKNPAEPMENLITAGQPSLKDFNKLAERGVQVVINLRTESEFSEFNEREAAEKLGLRYISIQVAGKDEINDENAQLLHEALEGLEKSTLIYCGSSNRVGGLLAYRAFKLQNKNASEALSIGKSAGMRSTESRVRELLGL